MRGAQPSSTPEPAAEPSLSPKQVRRRSTFGRVFREERTRAGWSHNDLAHLLVMDVRKVKDAEYGVIRMPVHRLGPMRELFGDEAGSRLVKAWVEAEGTIPIELIALSGSGGGTGNAVYPHPLALDVAVHFASWWSSLARAGTPQMRGVLAIIRWALSRLGPPPAGPESDQE